ncbi:MAG: hypothetical protein Q9N34_07385 [Aquificota bacterium]|nr:hypothetical protein [Aquificota bacterium]
MKDTGDLKLSWTIVLLIIVLYLATQRLCPLTQMRKPPENAMELKVTAFAWGWMFQYPNGEDGDSSGYKRYGG